MGSVGSNKNTTNIKEKVSQMSDAEISKYIKDNDLRDVSHFSYTGMTSLESRLKFDREIVEQHMEGTLRNAEKEPVIGGTKKVSDEIKELALSTFNEVSQALPILSDYTTGIEFNKYMDVAGLGYSNRIELNGALMQRYWKRNFKEDRDYVKGIIAHELTHTVQDRIAGKLNEKAKDFCDRVWDNAVKNYIADNPNDTEHDINRGVAMSYGKQGHSRAGNTSVEKIAVAMEHKYSNAGWKKL